MFGRRDRLTTALLAVALLAGGLGGCGGGSGAPRGISGATGGSRGMLGRGSTISTVATGPYRWLVPTGGSPPTVARENQHRGTTAWRLPGPAANAGGLAHGTVRGYVAEQSLTAGQTQRIYVSAPGAARVRIRVFRMGWYGGTGGREVLRSDRLTVVAQPPCTHRPATGLTECHWHPTLRFMIPPALPSGVYIAQLSASAGSAAASGSAGGSGGSAGASGGSAGASGGQSDCLFVVRASGPAPLLAQLPTSTYEAYNAWGGDSLYPGGADRVGVTGTTQGIEVSYDRPYDSNTGAGQFFARDVAMIRFLERHGYPVAYTTSESVDEDPGQLSGHRALIDFGHSEYWSARQAEGFARARAAGTSLLFFGSDTLGWRVRYAPASPAASEAGEPGHSIVAYKEHAALDPHRSQPSGSFPDAGASLTGSAYLGCITPRVQQPGAPTYRYYEWAPALGLHPSWLFAGTGITAATRIPGIVGYELDQRTAASPPGTLAAGGGPAPCMSVTAPGEPVPGPGQNRAETTLSTAPSGAIVFDTGTLGWELGLEPVPGASPDAPAAPDPRVVAMTRNVLARALGSGKG
ncbi:MAG: N,N-dimethylformamidase beta subunit family domain-containing protein [Solirubrobacteraceae bacterium]